MKLPHRACLECGYYDGKEIISSSEKKDKKK
jgi:ribosomal protein L32